MVGRLGIGALIPTFSEDVVAIFIQRANGDDEQILDKANLMRASINRRATYFKHPLENGRKIVDHRIIEPVEIELKIILVDKPSILELIDKSFGALLADTYDLINTFFEDGTVLSIQTRTTTYRNQIIESMPHEETSEMFDGVTLSFNTSELLTETQVTFDAADAGRTDTVPRGQQNPQAIPADFGSSLVESIA